MRGLRAAGDAEEAVADAGGNVDLARSAGDNVDLHQLLPQGAEAGGGGGRRQRFGGTFLVVGGIALRVEGELERLHAVVLGEIGHEGGQSPRRRGGVEEDLC